MPVYEYECEQCGTRFERIQSVRDEPVRRCPECSGTVHKVFHPAGIIFKGSGWYITDSRKSSSAATTANGGSSGSKSSESNTAPKESGEKKAGTSSKAEAPATTE